MSRKRTHRKKTKPIPIRQRIFAEGFSAGILWGISIVTGISIDPIDLRTRFLKSFCSVTDSNVLNCRELMLILRLIGLIVTILSITLEVTRLRKTKYFGNWPPWVEGLVFYGIGLIVGVFLIVAFS